VIEIGEFLNARLDEDEQMAQAASAGLPWRAGTKSDGLPSRNEWDLDLVYQYPDESGVVQCSPEEAPHIARHDPARVLAEVAAKRRIVEIHQRKVSDGYPDVIVCSECGPTDDERWRVQKWEQYQGGAWPCRTLRLLASVYAEHADYNPSWRPA
jgi:hypothetical protein